ncbi:MAG TPA: glycerate kinase [Verrucomicrobiae bacterium]|jgi:glycerate kinase|nr:glycerate kinase [Verrucomicrobiae bacterium]
MRVLIVPDKFKGTLTAHQAAQSIATGWRSARRGDFLDRVPMSDGGDGFGEVLSDLLGARPRNIQTLDAAHRSRQAVWWWQCADKLAIVESAKVVGLATLPPREFHPFQLDTAGLAKNLKAAATAKARQCLIGIGGSATNDGGFGMARALGWKFLDAAGNDLDEWWRLRDLASTRRPAAALKLRVTVAVDVSNPLLGPEGCSRVYGPQKGLYEFDWAEKCLERMALVLQRQHGIDCAKIPGAGAAGGLGFGLMAFVGAKLESGFELFARYSKLEKRIAAADMVVTGEGALDLQTHMGKGVGEIAALCVRSRIPCVALAGKIDPSPKHARAFTHARALTELTDARQAQARAAHFLEKLAREVATRVC